MAVNIDGNGLIALGGTSSTQGRVRLAEDSDNGTNYIELTAPASVASNRTITLPDNTGTIITTASTFAGTGPAFSAYSNNSQTITSATFTKMQINTEEFDTASCYDPTTNYRFTPNVAGYYQVNGNVSFNATVTAPQLVIYKNGGQFKVGTNPASGNWSSVSAVIYLNGSTDYIELYGAHVTGTTQTLLAAENYNYFQAFLARAA